MQTDEQQIIARTLKRLASSLALFFAALFLLLAGFVAGVAAIYLRGPELRRVIALTFPQVIQQQRSREERINLLWQVWDILDREYIIPPPETATEQSKRDEKMVHGAAAGLVAALGDPHTAFVEPLPAAILEQDLQGSFEGIGATVDLVGGRLVIVRPLPDSPASKAGLRAGDIVLMVDDQPLAGKTLLQAISLIRGPKGTTVRLRVQRDGVAEPFEVAVTRAKVELLTVESRMLEGNIAYLRLTEFNAVAAQKVREALSELLSKKPGGLVFDLRSNPGGYLHSAVEIASEFLPQDTLVLTEEERGKPFKEYRVEHAGVATDLPLVVLTNGSSASSSEIVAGAIRDHGRGKLIGETTTGKGSVQATHTLEDNSSLRVTIARWNLPKGQHLDGHGIEPDIKVPMTQDDVAGGKDPQLERAATYLRDEK